MKKQDKIKIIFLGTNGWYDTATGNTICILIETANEYVVLDAGNGIYKLDQYIKSNKPIYLFLSHFHLDHIIGLHILAKFRFPQGLNICIRKGSKKILKTIVNKDFTLALNKLPFKTRIIEIAGRNKHLPFMENALVLRHPVPCLGFRLRFGNKILAYVPDTGPCPNAAKLAKNANLLIAECAMKVGIQEEGWPHLDPTTAAKIAKKAKADRLLLVHFDAAIYQTLKERNTAEKQAKRIHKNTRAVRDNYMEVL
ncbi:MAG: ribonuclease Z [Candidatus Saganbacteria bacterium]|nr:ribonuclease Z [Candidatus Saganbacteria bacterium]